MAEQFWEPTKKAMLSNPGAILREKPDDLAIVHRKDRVRPDPLVHEAVQESPERRIEVRH